MIALLLDATLEVSGPAGPHRFAARDFLRSALATTLDDAEMPTRVELPSLPPAPTGASKRPPAAPGTSRSPTRSGSRSRRFRLLPSGSPG